MSYFAFFPALKAVGRPGAIIHFYNVRTLSKHVRAYQDEVFTVSVVGLTKINLNKKMFLERLTRMNCDHTIFLVGTTKMMFDQKMLLVWPTRMNFDLKMFLIGPTRNKADLEMFLLWPTRMNSDIEQFRNYHDENFTTRCSWSGLPG